MELAVHMDMCQDNDFHQLGHHVGDDQGEQCAMYSEQYLDQMLTPVAIKRILSRETEQISKPETIWACGKYMLWPMCSKAKSVQSTPGLVASRSDVT